MMYLDKNGGVTDNAGTIQEYINEITEYLSRLTRQERIAWFRKNAYVEPLNFLTEIDGTTYAVRAFFKEDARENITEKVQRIVLNSAEKNE